MNRFIHLRHVVTKDMTTEPMSMQSKNKLFCMLADIRNLCYYYIVFLLDYSSLTG